MTNKILVIFVYLLTAPPCFAALPDWVLHPPNSDTELFAIGDGNTLQQANNNALKNILGQLRTRISSSFNQQQTLTNNAFAEYINQSISSSIENLPISQYSQLKNHQEGGTFYSLVSVEKAQLTATFMSEINNNTYELNKQLTPNTNAGSQLEWWMDNRENLLSLYSTNLRYLNILNLLDYDTQKASQDMAKIEAQLSAKKQANCLYIQPHNNNELRLALRKAIVANDIPADNSHCGNTLVLEDTVQQRKLFGQYVATLTLNIEYQLNNNPVSTQTVIETGKSMSGESIARKAAYSRLVTRIETMKDPILVNLLKTK
jgi:DNA-directed RNA polymerase subunit F